MLMTTQTHITITHEHSDKPAQRTFAAWSAETEVDAASPAVAAYRAKFCIFSAAHDELRVTDLGRSLHSPAKQTFCKALTDVQWPDAYRALLSLKPDAVFRLSVLSRASIAKIRDELEEKVDSTAEYLASVEE